MENEVVVSEATEDEAIALCLILMGGWGGEYVVFNEHSRNASTDTEQVRHILGQIEPTELKMAELWHRCMNAVLEIVERNLKYLLRLARTLEMSREMNREQIFAQIDESFERFSIRWDILRHGRRE